MNFIFTLFFVISFLITPSESLSKKDAISSYSKSAKKIANDLSKSLSLVNDQESLFYIPENTLNLIKEANSKSVSYRLKSKLKGRNSNNIKLDASKISNVITQMESYAKKGDYEKYFQVIKILKQMYVTRIDYINKSLSVDIKKLNNSFTSVKNIKKDKAQMEKTLLIVAKSNKYIAESIISPIHDIFHKRSSRFLNLHKKMLTLLDKRVKKMKIDRGLKNKSLMEISAIYKETSRVINKYKNNNIKDLLESLIKSLRSESYFILSGGKKYKEVSNRNKVYRKNKNQF